MSEAGHEVDEAYKQRLNENIMIIFEACSYQHLAGQRIAKVVETVENIQKRVCRFVLAICAKDNSAPASKEEEQRNKCKKDLLVNSSAKTGEGVNQDDIDALLNS